jgi:predicted metal-dependent hydrolase
MDYDKELYEQQINFVDKQIDRLVYDLYGLTEEEIERIEKSIGIVRVKERIGCTKKDKNLRIETRSGYERRR